MVARSGRGDGGPPVPVDDACAPVGDDPIAGGDSGRWQVHRLAGTAASLHARAWPSPVLPTVWVLDVTGPALVLGSTQPEVGASAVDVVRRRSGGGAVLVRPGSPLWVDVLVPPHDRLWHDDVGRAFGWLGQAWVEALHIAGVEGARAHEGPLVSSPWSRAVCFAGLGPGEVTVDGRKVVGISQRRTRHGALFQCAALFEWDPAAMVDLLGLPAAAIGEMAGAAAGLPVDRAALEAALLAAVARW